MIILDWWNRLIQLGDVWVTRLRVILLVLLSPFAEKDPRKQLYDDVLIVLSAGRIIVYVLAFVWAKIGLAVASSEKGMPGWPFWTFGSVLAIALPLASALGKLAERDPAAVLEFAKTVYSRMGVGSGQGDVYPGDPETQADREHEPMDR